MSHYDWSVKRYLEETIYELRGSLQEAWDEIKEERERYIELLDNRDKDIQELQAEIDDLKRLLSPKAYVDEPLSEAAKKQAGLPPYEPQYSSTGEPLYDYTIVSTEAFDNIIRGTE